MDEIAGSDSCTALKTFFVCLWDMLFGNDRNSPQKCSLEKVFLKYSANLQEKIHAEVRFQ